MLAPAPAAPPVADRRAATLVVIPARDEAADVGDIVRRARLLGHDVVVVDDASSDATVQVARAAGATVLELPYQTGAWIAMQTGVRLALRQGYRYVVTLDADGQHDPAAIDRLTTAYDEALPDCNVVVGSCVSRASRGRRIAWRILRHLGSLHIRDLTSGYRLYDHTAMKIVAAREATLLQYQDVGVLLMLLDAGLRIVEVEVPMAARRHGKSRIFESWLKVLYYLLYSTLLCTSKRRLPRLEQGRHGAGA